MVGFKTLYKLASEKHLHISTASGQLNLPTGLGPFLLLLLKLYTALLITYTQWMDELYNRTIVSTKRDHIAYSV